LDIWVLIAGLSLFLFGMKQLEGALKHMSGKRFKHFISHSTNHPIRSVITGIISTTIVQSSSLVSLVVLAFVGAGVIPLVNAIGVVLGSNLGTTFTGWVVATIGFKMNLSAMIYPLLGVGGIGYTLTKGKLRSISLFIFSLGLLLIGLDFMKNSVHSFTDSLNLQVLQGLPLIVYLLFGVVVTAIIQSSSAVMMLVLTALYANVIALPAAAAVVIGADLGTSSTVLLGSLQGSVAQKRLAMAQVFFNLIVDVIAFLSIYLLLDFIRLINIEDSMLSLVAFHSIFNLLGLMIFIPFLSQYSNYMERFIKEDKNKHLLVQYINSVPEKVTDAALKALDLETKRLISLVLILNLRVLRIESQIVNRIDIPFAFKNKTNLAFYMAIKKLEGEIINYALKVQMESKQSELDEEEQSIIAHQIDHYMKATRGSIYSAKSLKDIHENLNTFDEIDNQQLTQYYREIIKAAEKNYTQIAELMNQDGDLIEETTQHLRENVIKCRQHFRSQIHQQMSSQLIGSFNLSTLLNVNQEIFTSEDTLINALNELMRIGPTNYSYEQLNQ
jgi:phosphate:Na+ symporter